MDEVQDSAQTGALPIVRVTWTEAKRFAGIRSQLLDLDLALKCLVRLRQLVGGPGADPVVCHALYATAIGYYARCFTSGARAGMSASSLNLTKTAELDHERLMGLRNKFLAHSVNALDQVIVGFMVPPPDSQAKVKVCDIRVRNWNLKPDGLASMERHIREVRKMIEAASNAAYQTLLTKAQATPIADLRALPVLDLELPADLNNAVVRTRRRF